MLLRWVSQQGEEVTPAELVSPSDDYARADSLRSLFASRIQNVPLFRSTRYEIVDVSRDIDSDEREYSIYIHIVYALFMNDINESLLFLFRVLTWKP